MTQTKQPYMLPLQQGPTSILDRRVVQPDQWHLLPADVRERVEALTRVRNNVHDLRVAQVDQEIISVLAPYNPADPTQYMWCVYWRGDSFAVPGCSVHSRHTTEGEAGAEAARCNRLVRHGCKYTVERDHYRALPHCTMAVEPIPEYFARP
jgi:hypothetical protein